MYAPLTEPDFAKTVLQQQKTDNARHKEITEWLEHHDKRLDRIEAQLTTLVTAVNDLKNIILTRIYPTQEPTQ